MIDVFAWIVLLILVASTIAIFAHGRAARPDRQEPRTPVGHGRDRRRMGHPDLRVRALAARADLGLCRHSRARPGGRRRDDRRPAQRFISSSSSCW